MEAEAGAHAIEGLSLGEGTQGRQGLSSRTPTRTWYARGAMRSFGGGVEQGSRGVLGISEGGGHGVPGVQWSVSEGGGVGGVLVTSEGGGRVWSAVFLFFFFPGGEGAGVM